MNHALRTAAATVIEDVFEDSLLQAQGLIDSRALLRAYRRFCSNPAEPHIDQILGALVLELTLRSIERRHTLETTKARPGKAE